jgi:hypothetical protein
MKPSYTITADKAWLQYLEGKEDPQNLVRALLDTIHHHSTLIATPTTWEGQQAIRALNATRVALSILDEENKKIV